MPQHQRGRKRTTNVVALRVDGSPPPLRPPSYLNAEERQLFCELVGSVDTTAFVASDTPLLVSYVQAVLLARQTAHDPEERATWVKAVRLQATLATRLRLAPQSRVDKKTAGVQQRHKPSRRPWEEQEDDIEREPLETKQ